MSSAYLIERCPAAYRDIDKWQTFDSDRIENVRDRKRYLALIEATRLLFAGARISEVIAASPVSYRQFERLFLDAVEFLPNAEGIVGRQAFVAHARKKPPQTCKKTAPATLGTLIDCCPVVYRVLEAWPLFDDSCIKSSKGRKRFKALVKTAEMVLANQPLDEVMKHCPVSWRQFGRLFRHAMEIKPDNTGIWGLEAFNAWMSGKPRERTKPFKKFEGNSDKAGYSGLFKALLSKHPEVEQCLIDYLNKKSRPNTVSPHVLHVEFKRILTVVVGLQADEYPLSTISEGRRPLDQWFTNVYQPRYQLRWLGREQGKSAAQVLAFAQGDGTSKLPNPPYTAFSLDEYTVDVKARYEFPSVLGDWEQLELRRFAVTRMREISMGITVATRLVLTPQTSGEDISILLYEGLSGQPKAAMVVPGLDYSKGAGYPANMFESLRWVAPRAVFLDNALSHLKDAVQNILTDLGGGEVYLGAAATPQERAGTESEFGMLARRLIHQLPETTGSHHKDPVRKGAEVKLEGRIEVEALEHTIDVYTANSNALPTAASGHIAPLERLRRLIAAGKIEPVRVPANKRHAYYFSQPIRRVVRASIGDKRHPRAAHINFRDGTFSSPLLKARPGMKGSVLFIRPDYRNLQTVAAFYEDGRLFGMLQAEGYWGRVPNDIRIRKIYATHRNAARLGDRADDQPLQALFKYLSAGAPTDKTLALQLAYVIRFLERNFQGLQLAEMEIDAAIAQIRQAAPAANEEVEEVVKDESSAAESVPSQVANANSCAVAVVSTGESARTRFAGSDIPVPRLARK